MIIFEGRVVADQRRTLAQFFRSVDSPRDKFLARLFGLFSEQLVRIWSADPRAQYEDLGRPTLWAPTDTRGATLDFTLRDRSTGKVYAAELKAELEFEGYRYMTLERLDQLAHHKLPAFQRFLELARDPAAYQVRVQAKPLVVDGVILIWGAVTRAGREAVSVETGIHFVLSLDEMIAELRLWRPDGYDALLGSLRGASDELFDWLDPKESGSQIAVHDH